MLVCVCVGCVLVGVGGGSVCMGEGGAYTASQAA